MLKKDKIPMKHRRKSEKCLNCQTPLQPDFEFCPQCGQENTNNYVNSRELFYDLIGNYLTLDSRFGRSILPFLFFPAKLPTAFIEGERMKYLPPVRLYLIISVIYFFVFNQTILKIELRDDKLKHAIEMANETSSQKDEIAKNILKEIEKDSLKMQKILAENPQLNQIEFISARANSWNLKRKELEQAKKDTSLKKLDSIRSEKNEKNRDSIDLGDFGSWDRENVQKWVTDPKMSPEGLLDSMKIKDKNEIFLRVSEQVLKVGRNDISIFIQNVVGNISLMMLLLLPVFAFYLKILYLFAKKLYIGHLILMLYFQSFVYFVGITDLVLIYGVGLEVESILPFNAVWFLVYVFFMFKGVYQQGYLLTFIKMITFLTIYYLSFVVFLLAEMFFSFWFF